MILTNDPVRIIRIGIHQLLDLINQNSIVLEPELVSKYKEECEEVLAWVDGAEKILY